LSLFGLALAAHLIGDAVSGIAVSAQTIGKRTMFLALGLMDASSFGLTILAGLDINVLDVEFWRRSINFWFLSSIVAVGVATLLQVVRNLGSWMFVAVFPYSFYNAFHDGIDVEANTTFERLILQLFGSSQRRRRTSWLDRLFN